MSRPRAGGQKGIESDFGTFAHSRGLFAALEGAVRSAPALPGQRSADGRRQHDFAGLPICGNGATLAVGNIRESRCL